MVVAKFTPRKLLVTLLLLTAVTYWVAIACVNLDVTRGHVIGSDGLFYYEYLPSFFLDGDLDFKNQRQMLIAEGVPYSWGALHPAAGNLTYFAPGWAVLVAPFFLGAHALGKVLSLLWPVRMDGYGFLHESLTNFGAVSYGCAGVWLVFEALKRWFDERTALLTAVGVLGATNLAYYVMAQASMAHSVGFFAVAGVVYCCSLLPSGSEPARAPSAESPLSGACRSSFHGSALPWSRNTTALGLGVFSGLAFIVRPQLVLCVAPVFAYVAWLPYSQGRGVPWRELSFMLLGAVAVGSIQLVTWYSLFGRAIVVPQGRGFLNLREPEVLELLFSLRHGLFSWHPFYLLCFIGLAFGRDALPLRILSLACILLQVYVNASVSDWWAGNAFGLRRFIDVLPFFAIGGALLLERLARFHVVAPLLGGLLTWNVLFMIQYRLGYIPRGEAITWQQLVADKFRLLQVPRRY
jgi:hypothetical protein